MFEVYAVTACLVLPTGMASLIYFAYHLKSSSNRMAWTLIFQSVATVILGVFYVYSAIVLSGHISNEAGNNLLLIDDLAIIVNDTFMYDEMELDQPDQNNEIEGTRHNKDRTNEFLTHYQKLVKESTKNKSPNAARAFYRTVDANNSEEIPQKTVESENCFLRMFFYQALLVYSFISSALALLNTCQICKQCTKLEAVNSTQEKASDNISDSSSQNSMPIRPLFEDASPNLEVFSVKKAAPTQQAAPCNEQVLRAEEEAPILTAGKCVTTLVLPIILVAILYAVLNNSSKLPIEDGESFQLKFLGKLNETQPDAHTENLIKNFSNGKTAEAEEVTNILRHVYGVINKFQETHKELPSAVGRYTYKSRIHNDTECFQNETSLKAFDFTVVVITFFAVIFYTKLSQVKMSNGNINKCILGFFVLWLPSVMDMVVSRFLTSKEPDLLSSLLLLIGNIDKLYSTKQNVNTLKNAPVRPVQD